MEFSRPKNTAYRSRFRTIQRWGAVLLLGLPVVAWADDLVRTKPTLHRFVHDMPRTVRADHPAILPVAAAIRAVTTDPIEQLVMVNDVSHLLVDYDDDERVYGRPEYFATLDDMLEKRRQEGWLYLRDDCDGRAVFAAHLLASLGIPWRLEASFWKRHAWVIARVRGVDYDLIDFYPGGQTPKRLSYRLVGRWFVRASHRPPSFSWRQCWALRTNQDLPIGLRLGLLTLDSTPGALHERNSTDWAEESPRDRRSPADPRVRTAAIAGFPYGEALRGSGIADLRIGTAGATSATESDVSGVTPSALPLATNSADGTQEF